VVAPSVFFLGGGNPDDVICPSASILSNFVTLGLCVKMGVVARIGVMFERLVHVYDNVSPSCRVRVVRGTETGVCQVRPRVSTCFENRTSTYEVLFSVVVRRPSLGSRIKR